jgi:hypothetical protein
VTLDSVNPRRPVLVRVVPVTPPRCSVWGEAGRGKDGVMYGVPDGDFAPPAAEDPAVRAAEDVARLFDRPGLGRLERLARKATTHLTSSSEPNGGSVPSNSVSSNSVSSNSVSSGQPGETW